MSAGKGSGTIFLGRQAIFDRKNDLFAYELLFREAGQTAAEITNDSRATARVIVNTLSGVGMERVLGGVPGFVNMGEEFLMSDFVFLLSPEHFVLEILETVPVTPAVVDRCRELRSRGFRLALDDYAGDRETWDPLLPLVDFVKVDFMKAGGPELENLTRTKYTRGRRGSPVSLLARRSTRSTRRSNRISTCPSP
jgi:EAL and modified HD-GYP domain-containing signal transduction protein